jgi:hypothetical protein
MAARAVLFHLLAVAIDDVTPPGQRHCLGLVVDDLLPLGRNERDEGSGIVEYEFAHKLVTLANPKDVEKPARLQLGDRLGADHAAIGDDANPADGKRSRKRSTTGIRLPVSAVFPGHISVHTGRPSPSRRTARII